MEWEIITTAARLDEVMRRPGHMLVMLFDDGGKVCRYTGPVPSEDEEPDLNDFQRVAYVTAKALRDWVGEPDTPDYREDNGPFCSTWVVPGMELWKGREGLRMSACGEFLVDVNAGTITYRPAGHTMAIADVYEAAGGPPPRKLAEATFISRQLHVLAALLPDDYPVPPPPKFH